MSENSEFPTVVPESQNPEYPELLEPGQEDDEEVLIGLCPVVGIGASAGGFEAFIQLLQELPKNTGMAFVFVQHLDPRHDSSLAALLARHTPMPVTQARNGTGMEPNHVYVIPPNTTMAVQKGILLLSPRGTDAALHMPIDHFFCSLAKDQKSHAVGVILSGSASDGTIGLKAIKSAGGITFAQDETAKFDSMPRNAAAASAVDFILPPALIAGELTRIAHHAYLESTSPPSAAVEDGPVLQRILALVHKAKTVDFTHYKKPTIRRRLARRMALHHQDSAESYFTLLEKDPAEINALFDDLLINVTEFFRDPDVFEALSKTALPEILANRKPEAPIRVWVPGCSSGEEVYSIAICFHEYLEKSEQSFPMQIFGTDISERAVESARAGKYPESISAVVSPERLQRYFLKLDNGGYQIAKFIRELCLFSRQNLTKDPPISRMDLISCRNLLIYLGPILQRRVLTTFSYALNPAGCLLLGRSESLGSLVEHFVALDRDRQIYRQNPGPARPVLEFDRVRGAALTPVPAPQQQGESAAFLLDREADRLVLEAYGPSGFLVNASHEVVKFRGDVHYYLATPKGRATLDVFVLIREEISVPVREAFEEAAATNKVARRDNILFGRNNRSEEINIVAQPVPRSGSGLHFLILFEEAHQQKFQNPVEKQNDFNNGASLELVGELASTRSYLQTLIEELQTANEEAQSANEELQSTNEELQTAKEELQSSNEELTTTNDEMTTRNVELRQVNDDLLNLLSSMRIPIVMLNRDLRIRRFTPSAEKALNLIPTDVGRPLSDLKPRINVPDLEELLAKAIWSVTALEREVQDQDGHWYSMRINPYRTGDNRVEGAVLQLLDIDQLKRTVEIAENARNYSATIFETVREPLAVLDSERNVKVANDSFFETFDIPALEAIGHSIFEVSNQRWNTPKVHQLLDDVVFARERRFQDVEIEHWVGDSSSKTFRLNARSLKGENGEGQVLLSLEDVTDQKRAAEAKYRRLFETAKDGILIVDGETGEITDVNPFLMNLFGYGREELIGKPFWEASTFFKEGKDVLDRLRSNEVVRLTDSSIRTKDDRYVDIEAIGNIYSEGEKRTIQFNIRDVTERKQFDRKLEQTAKLESLGLLAGGVAHDFNNLLTGIMGTASLMLDNAPIGSQDREQLRRIVKATDRAANLTRQMLAYSGRGRFVVEAIDFSALVEEISSLLRSSIPKTIDFELDLAPSLPPINADATQMQQLVMNLAINGAEAIDEGKRGYVRLTTAQETIDPKTIRMDHAAEDLKPGTYVRLEVKDSGSGMDEATKAKIFDPFFTTKFTGRGLGLSAAVGIVKGHRGAIRIESEPGMGTTFTVLFPASPSSQIQKQMEQKTPDIHGGGLILVVDDEETVLDLAKSALERFGYQVLTAPNGEVGVELVRKRGDELCLVILDFTMPVMGGAEAFQQIKAIRPGLPVILSSGYDEKQATRTFQEKDLRGFLQKPYSVQMLLGIVKATIESLG